MKKIMILILLLFIIITGIYIYRQNNTKNSENSEVSEVSNTLSNEVQNEIQNTDSTAVIINKLSPSGFMGSSLYRVDLYSNGDVYAITFDGNGYQDSNIISKNLVAKNASSIEMDESDEGQGGIIVMGGDKINENFGWISFQ